MIEKLKELSLLYNPLSKEKIKSLKLKEFPSVSTYEKYFGTWNNAKRIAGLKTLKVGSEKRNNIEPSKQRNTPLKLRFFILTRDNFLCQYCGRGINDGVKLMIDHIKPYSKGGLTEEDNLITSCFECNIGKKDLLIDFNNNRNNK